MLEIGRNWNSQSWSGLFDNESPIVIQKKQAEPKKWINKFSKVI